MTGYGRGASSCGGISISVELRSVNHRGLDIRPRMAGELAFLELELLGALKARLGRGRVEARVDLERSGELSGPRLDTELARRVHAELAELAESLGTEVSLAEVLTAPGLWVSSEAALDEAAAEEALRGATAQALDALTATRAREGEALTEEMRGLLVEAEAAVERAKRRAPERVVEYRARLEEHVAQLTEGVVSLDPGRLATEVALFADRVDVAEELQRAEAHIEALRGLLKAPHGEAACVGKRVDFYLQELGREANTLASKSRDADLTATAIALKSAQESMREQAANAQ